MVAILVIAVVAAAGAYVLLSGDSNDDNNDVIKGKMGIGSKVYYDNISNSTAITGELVGESESQFYIQYTYNSVNHLVVEMDIVSGDIGSATLDNGVWKLEITDADKKVTRAEIKIGTVEGYGIMISEISVWFDGKSVFDAKIRSSQSDILPAYAYKPSEHQGKYLRYNMDCTMTFTEYPVSLKMDTTGYIQVTVIGDAVDDQLLVKMEGHLEITTSPKVMDDIEYSFSQYDTVGGVQEAVPDTPSDISELPEPVVKQIAVGGKTVTANMYTYKEKFSDIDSDVSLYLSLDGSMLYLMEYSGSETFNGVTESITMKIEYVEGDF